MSVLFDNVKPGDTVHYSTPQGQTGKGKVVMNRGTHLVLNAGGRYGRPQVVTDKNYIKHSRDGKVVGALLSRLSQVKDIKEDSHDLEGKSARVEKTKKHKKKLHEVSKELAKRYVIAAVKDINHSSREAEGARTAAYADYMNKKAVKRSNAIAKSTKAMRAYKDHVWGKDITKEETVNELSTNKLTQYVSKAIADRKKAGREFEIASKDQYAATPAQDKSFGRITKRSKGIAKAVGKIAKAYEETTNEAAKLRIPRVTEIPSNDTPKKKTPEQQGLIPSGIHNRHGHPEPLKKHTDSEEAKHGGWSGMNEVSAPGKEAWIKANKQRFIDRYGKEKGLRVLYAKAWKDVKEARENEWAANRALAGQSSKPEKGHYLMRDGRRLSGPHSPEDAVKEYKKMNDSKGVKIVHVKETHQFDVTRELISEDKVKKAAKLAINLKKKANGNKHVNTEPTLDTPRTGTSSALNDHGSEDQNVTKL